MAIKALPTLSDKVLLRDISDEVALLEGECSDDDAAYVIVRQATESDHRQIAQMYSKRKVRWGADDSVEEVRDTNMRDEWAWQCFLCLCEAGNLFAADGSAIFSFTDGPMYERRVEGKFSVFLKRYGVLQSAVTKAMRYAIWDLNPLWDIRPRPAKEGSEEEGE